MKKRVLFVCLGNICRSPMAEAVFRHLVEEKGLRDSFVIQSAGTASWHEGKPPHEGTRAKLDEVGISYAGMTARQVTLTDFEQFDYIIVMDDDNKRDLETTFSIPKHVKVGKLLDYVESPRESNVPDPYYTGDFNYTYELVHEASECLLETILQKN